MATMTELLRERIDRITSEAQRAGEEGDNFAASILYCLAGAMLDGRHDGLSAVCKQFAIEQLIAKGKEQGGLSSWEDLR